MRYSIGYLLSGEAGKFHEKKRRELAKKFNEPYLLDNPIPSHSTLKYPFSADKEQIKKIEGMIQVFVKKQNKEKIEIRKINNFHKKVVSLQLDFSKGANKIFRDLVKELGKFDWLEWGEYDKILDCKFHATLVYGNTPDNFKRIWKEASDLKPKFDIEFDNIAILKKPRRYWKIHKIYKIK